MKPDEVGNPEIAPLGAPVQKREAGTPVFHTDRVSTLYPRRPPGLVGSKLSGRRQHHEESHRHPDQSDDQASAYPCGQRLVVQPLTD